MHCKFLSVQYRCEPVQCFTCLSATKMQNAVQMKMYFIVNEWANGYILISCCISRSCIL